MPEREDVPRTCFRSITRVMWACSAEFMAEKSIARSKLGRKEREEQERWSERDGGK